MKKPFLNEFLLLITAFIWGSAFVAQSVGTGYVGPWTFTCVRNIIASIALYPVVWYLTKDQKQKDDTLKAGILCGILLFSASILQQIGIAYTTAGKAGFITALYVVLVPLFASFLGQKITKRVWFAVFLAMIGFYLLSIHGTFQLSKGDFLILLCAFLFAFHILTIDHFQNVKPVKVAWIQFLVCAILGFIPMMVFEKPTFEIFNQGKYPILYAGLLSSSIGYTLQIIGQKNVNPTTATLILSLEAVFAVICGAIYLHEMLSLRELVGCILVFIGILLVQLK